MTAARNPMDSADAILGPRKTSGHDITPALPPRSATVNGRDAEDWEKPVLEAAVLAGRQQAASLLDGLTRNNRNEERNEK